MFQLLLKNEIFICIILLLILNGQKCNATKCQKDSIATANYLLESAQKAFFASDRQLSDEWLQKYIHGVLCCEKFEIKFKMNDFILEKNFLNAQKMGKDFCLKLNKGKSIEKMTKKIENMAIKFVEELADDKNIKKNIQKSLEANQNNLKTNINILKTELFKKFSNENMEKITSLFYLGLNNFLNSLKALKTGNFCKNEAFASVYGRRQKRANFFDNVRGLIERFREIDQRMNKCFLGIICVAVIPLKHLFGMLYANMFNTNYYANPNNYFEFLVDFGVFLFLITQIKEECSGFFNTNTPFSLQNLESSKIAELKLCIHYEMVHSTRNIKVNLIYSDDGSRSNLKNDEKFEVKVNGELDQHSFDFDVFVETENNRSMIISINVLLFKPDYSRRYLINLGSFAPQGLWWNRRIFIESEKDSGNYHAFLYAHLDEENSEIKKEFLGYATLAKINNENASNSLSEYRLSIPINLNRFINSKIVFIELNIYQYEKSKYSLDTLRIANETKDICTICLAPIIESQFIIKLHGENGNKSAHIFHKDCVKKWFDYCIGKLRCPFCNQELKSVMTVLVPPRFERVSDSFSNCYFNSISKLIQISNGSNDAFKRRQAEFGIKYIITNLEEKEEKVRKLLEEIDFQHNNVQLSEEKFVEIRGEELFENPIVEYIRKGLEIFLLNRQNSEANIMKAQNALSLIFSFKYGPQSGNFLLEHMQNMEEENEEIATLT